MEDIQASGMGRPTREDVGKASGETSVSDWLKRCLRQLNVTEVGGRLGRQMVTEGFRSQERG